MLRTKFLVWALLAVPALLIGNRYLTSDGYPGDYLKQTGEWAARLLILALMLTPLSILFPRARWVSWLLSHRRAIGVAAFAYSLLHLLFYLADLGTLQLILAELGAFGIWTGWAAFLLLLPIALSSNRFSVARLGRRWKQLQRLAYPAALLTLLHWMFVHDGLAAALLSFAPLALLQCWRVALAAR